MRIFTFMRPLYRFWILEFGFWIDGIASLYLSIKKIKFLKFAIRNRNHSLNPQSEIRNPQSSSFLKSAIRNPKSAIVIIP
ncbi:hypothetical protein D1AOALGA4SA_12154 [Olavius algarvensis Delta 1 endosymbiont]|nr:hypothetical protein D1AOALGA4SA_12154 [Olavius algarvensis Delta 1 endosymbiont]